MVLSMSGDAAGFRIFGHAFDPNIAAAIEQTSASPSTELVVLFAAEISVEEYNEMDINDSEARQDGKFHEQKVVAGFEDSFPADRMEERYSAHRSGTKWLARKKIPCLAARQRRHCGQPAEFELYLL
jgi:hypothetical protein